MDSGQNVGGSVHQAENNRREKHSGGGKEQARQHCKCGCGMNGGMNFSIFACAVISSDNNSRAYKNAVNESDEKKKSSCRTS